MTFQRKTLGKFGEDQAEKELLKLGYEILERNYRNKIGEIDIIAKDNGVLCFVEVKAKTGSEFGLPEEMVNAKKQNKIIKTAEYYLIDKELSDIDWRIDVVAVEEEEIRVLKNAVERNIIC